MISHSALPLAMRSRKHISEFLNVTSSDVLLSYTLEKKHDIGNTPWKR